MNLVKICCIKYFTGASQYSTMSDFQAYDITDYTKMMYINVDNIMSLSQITYKTISGKRYYGYCIYMNNGYKYWVKCNTNSYEYLTQFINKEDNKQDTNTKKHLNKKK